MKTKVSVVNGGNKYSDHMDLFPECPHLFNFVVGTSGLVIIHTGHPGCGNGGTWKGSVQEHLLCRHEGPALVLSIHLNKLGIVARCNPIVGEGETGRSLTI